jgi:class 3 adenylate cyclase/tetratricopeptide (TPR) repeat protein
MEVAAWLKSLGLEQYARAFADNHVDFAILGQLTDADLRELGVTSLGHRKRLLTAIAARSATTAPIPEPTVGTLSGERRQVTIVFADLCDFTALSQSLDPEELQALVGRYTNLVDGIIHDYGGTVDKHIGDAVMALFGAPKAHDDDPVRAARAALDIHAALPRLSESVGRPLQAHVGVASGEVVAGVLARAEAQDYTVLGDSVNLAARLVAAAGAGETLISEGVYRALSGRGVCDALGPQQFKGIEDSVRVWRLRDLSGEDAPSASRPFVGRVAELEQFKGILGACLSRRGGQVVYVRGEAGIGKTRLVEEMRRLAEAQGLAIHRALVLDFGVGKGQGAIGAILCGLLDVTAGADAAARRNAVERAVAAGIVTAEQRVFLDDLLDLSQRAEGRAVYDAMDRSTRNRGKQAVVTALTTYACRRLPLMVIVEDLHWADQQLLDHLAVIASAVVNGPGLLAMTSRVEGDPVDAAWRARCSATPFATIDLGPLRQEEALRLAASFIDATQRFALACVDRAGGNPLFLEQLLRNAEEGSEDVIPASIQSLVLARMDRLTPVDRQAFQAASVIGQRFELPLLRKMLGLPDYVCDALVDHALVFPEGEGFLFAHALIQEGAYSSVLRTRRRELHLIVAEWFATDDPLLHAQHLDRAQDPRATRAYFEAAKLQRAGYQAESALRLIDRALEIVRADDERHALMCLKGELYHDLGDIAGSISIHRQAIAAAPDEASLCRAQVGLAEGLRISEGLTEALDLLKTAQQHAERHDLVPELARIHHLRGNILFPLGKIDDCRAEHELGLGYAQRSGSPEAEARALGGLADAAYAQGRMRTAFAHFTRCVGLSREHGFGRIEVANQSMVGFSRVYLNELRQAREEGSATVRAAALVGQPRAEMLGETIGVLTCLELGLHDEMQVHLEREMRLVRQLGARRFKAQNLEMRARHLLDTGRRTEAVALLRDALTICREVGMQFCGPRVHSALARAVETNDECGRLLAHGEELLGRGAVGHNHLWFYRDAIEAMLTAGNAAGALRYADLLEEYTRAEPLPWSQLFVARGRALARALQGRTNGAARDELTRVRAELLHAGFQAFLSQLDGALVI